MISLTFSIDRHPLRRPVAARRAAPSPPRRLAARPGRAAPLVARARLGAGLPRPALGGERKGWGRGELERERERD